MSESNELEVLRERCAGICDALEVGYAADLKKFARRLSTDTIARADQGRTTSALLAERIRALDLPLTSAREVTDVVEAGRCPMCHGRPGMMDAPTGPLVERLESTLRRFDETHGSYFVFNVADIRQAVAALASAPQPANPEPRKDGDANSRSGFSEPTERDKTQAQPLAPAGPQPACVGDDAILVAELRAIIDEGDRYGTAAKNSTTIYTRQRIEAAAQRIEDLSPAPSPQAGGEEEARREGYQHPQAASAARFSTDEPLPVRASTEVK